MVHVRDNCNYVLHRHKNGEQGKVSKLRISKTWSWRGVNYCRSGKGRKLEGNGDRQAAKCRAPFLEKEAGRWAFLEDH